MKRVWRDTLAAMALGWMSGSALAQVPMGLPAGPPTAPPPVNVVTPPAPAPVQGSTSAPQTPAVLASQTGDKGKIGAAKTDPPPECCPRICCPAVTPVICQDPQQCFDDHGCGPKWHWELGGGIYYVQPNFETNPAFREARTVGGITTTRQRDFRHNMEISPHAFIGVTHECGFGVRGRWFNFQHDATERVTAEAGVSISPVNAYGLVPAPRTLATGETLTATSDVRFDVWDLEFTQAFSCGQWNVLMGGGARYTHMAQGYRSVQASPAGASITEAGTHNINAIGSSFVIEGRRRICESAFSLYGNARGAILFGSAEAIGTSVSRDAAGAVITGSQTISQQTDVLPVGEIEVGLEFGRDYGRAHLFAQTGFFGQAWFGAGNASLTSVGGLNASNSGNLGFVGATVRVGVAY